MQLTFNLPEIDRKATKLAVEKVLETYQLYQLQDSLNRLPVITSNYSAMPRSTDTRSSTESSALANVEYEQKRMNFLRWVETSCRRLTKREQELLNLRYLQVQDDMYDYVVYGQLNLSERQYYRLKATTFYKLAFALRVVVYKEEVQ